MTQDEGQAAYQRGDKQRRQVIAIAQRPSQPNGLRQCDSLVAQQQVARVPDQPQRQASQAGHSASLNRGSQRPGSSFVRMSSANNSSRIPHIKAPAVGLVNRAMPSMTPARIASARRSL